jgi:glycosyltransferase involved in cell wall biosynthesis
MSLPAQNLAKQNSLSIVVPCYNEADVIRQTHARLSTALQATGLDYEIVYVNDGSEDNTLAILRELQVADDRVRVVSFARNFGHQVAVTAGVEFTTGDAVVLIDADLQDPPELIQEMVRMWADGNQVVYGVRKSRSGESAFKLLTAKFFYRIINSISDVKIPPDTGDFRLMDRRVVNVLKNMPERDRFLRGMVSWIGFRQTPLHYARSERVAGGSKYPLRKMILFALDGIVSFSLVPLRLATLFGFIAALVCGLGILYAIALRLFTGESVSGFTLIFISTFFLGSTTLFCLGIIGEYEGRIYRELKRRPLYVVEEVHGYQQEMQQLGYDSAGRSDSGGDQIIVSVGDPKDKGGAAKSVAA